MASTSFWQAEVQAQRTQGAQEAQGIAGPLQGDTSTEVAIIGAGITGTATALALARSGVAVSVLEARSVAAGASGRNGGFLATGTIEPYVRMIARFGSAHARRLWAASVDNAQLARGLIEELNEQGYSCGYRRDGILKLAASEAEWQAAQANAQLMQEDGWGAELVQRHELPLRLRTAYYGATFHAENAELQPAQFVTGLAHLARQAGAVFHEQTPVTGITLNDDGATLTTPHGSVHARDVVLATNAWLPSLGEHVGAHGLSDYITPTRGQMIATEPVDERLFPCPCAGNHGYQYWRQLADGRLVVGGWRNLSFETEYTDDETPNDAVQQHLDAFVHETLGLPSVRIERRWAGIMAFSKDSVPLVGRLPGTSHCYIAGGYTGHGNAYAIQCAQIISALVQGRAHPHADLFDPARFVSRVSL